MSSCFSKKGSGFGFSRAPSRVDALVASGTCVEMFFIRVVRGVFMQISGTVYPCAAVVDVLKLGSIGGFPVTLVFDGVKSPNKVLWKPPTALFLTHKIIHRKAKCFSN